ncbi:MAG: WD40 repeat domain-containing protein, partial [Planctomycetota bacterium]
RFLLAASTSGSADLVDVGAEPKNWALLRGHSGPIRTATMSRDEQWVATGSTDKTVRIWPTAPLPFLASLNLPNPPPELLDSLVRSPGR